MAYLKVVAQGFWSLLVGLRVTIGHLFTKKVTERYPHVEPELSDAYRGTVVLIEKDELGTHDCVACGACQRVCPSHCIVVTGGKVPGLKKKRPDHFEMNFALCSLCGLCIDACPTDTLGYSKQYDDVGYTREWTFDLLAPYAEREESFREAQAQREAAAAEAKKKAAADKKRKAAEAAKKKAEAQAAKDKAEASGAEQPTPREEDDA